MFKSIFGLAVTAAALALAISPETRKSVRKLAVKGTEVILDISDEIKKK